MQLVGYNKFYILQYINYLLNILDSRFSDLENYFYRKTH